MSKDILPDSRLRESKNTVLVDWLFLDAQGIPRRIRLELEPIFCFNCGKPAGHVPAGIMSFVSWMCQPCSEKWGRDACLHNHSDQEFWDAVAHEMLARFGRFLTAEELDQMAIQGKLGTALELLERESPYRKSMPSH